MNPKSTGASVRLSCKSDLPSTMVFSSSRMIAKIIVVAPTTAVPISTGLAVALKVLPAESFASR
jgi:hypothetical protein